MSATAMCVSSTTKPAMLGCSRSSACTAACGASKLSSRWRPSCRGLFEVKATIVDDKTRHRTYVTPKGLRHFATKLGKPTTKLIA